MPRALRNNKAHKMDKKTVLCMTSNCYFGDQVLNFCYVSQIPEKVAASLQNEDCPQSRCVSVSYVTIEIGL
jgi:hypothetical protein